MKSSKPETRKTRLPHQVDPAEYTPDFAYRGARGAQQLSCEGVSLTRIADSVGTPAYVYSQHSIETAYRKLDRAFGSLPHALCYAVKANGNLSVLRVLARLGSSFDIVSGGELDRLGHAGVSGDRIVFSGVGKTREEIREALQYRHRRQGSRGIFLFNVESAGELEVLLSESSRLVGAGSLRPFAAMRVNPDVLAGGHRHISTGYHHHKFGVSWDEARRLYLAHRDSRWIKWYGISAHIGSQILTLSPYRRALTIIAAHVRELKRYGVRLDCIDIGGGLGIRYTTETPPAVAAYARTLAQIVRPLGCRLLLEPGRTLVGPAGVLLTRVLYTKENGAKTFVIVDAAMNDLIRPVLYDAIHPITTAVRAASSRHKPIVDVVGPVCETGDYLVRDWPLDPVSPGDLLVVWAAGAYGFAESSNYNARPRAAEVLVNGRHFRVIRRRETLADMVHLEP